jgi:hypothetical protein
MAISGSSVVHFTDWNHLFFEWNVVSQSIDNNTTTISWTLYHKAQRASGIINSTVQKTWAVNIDGTEYSGYTSVAIGPQSGYDPNDSRLYRSQLASGSATIPHNIDGTKTFSYSFYVQYDITFSDNWIGQVGLRDTVYELDVIPRASDFTVSDGTLGIAQIITVAQKNPALTHGITYSCGSVETQLICAWNTSATSVSFTPPIDLAWQAVNGTRVWVDIHLQTYDSGGTPIGSTITKGVWMTIPDSVKPSCTLSVSDPTGYANKYGGYIQGQSKVAIEVLPTTAYGSAINKYVVTAEGVNYTTPEVTIPVIQSTGNVTINATVTDTRGRSGSNSKSITVIPYTVPTITMLKVHRCNADGTENDKGLYGKVTYGYVIDSLSGQNGMSGYIQYKKTSDSTYTTHELPTALTVTNGTFIFAADDGVTYDVQLLIADNFISVSHRTALSTAYTLIHYSPTGKGITFGGIRTGEGFNVVDMPFKINDFEVDYTVEQGESDGWFYRKWNSGIAECWKVYYGQVGSGKNNYSGFYYSETIMVPFPFTFANLPTVTVDGGSVTYMNFVRVFGKYSDKASFTVVGLTNAGTVDITVDIKAIGKWK